MDKFGFQTLVELGGVKVIILDSIPGPIHHAMLQSAHTMQGFQLYLPRHRRTESVHVVFAGINTFRFKEELMLLLVGKGDNFRFYAWAVTRTDALNLSVIEWRVRQSATKNLMRGRIGVGDKATHLLEFAVH